MKEIDFLPEWYKEGKRRRVHMRQQCLVLGLIFVAMITYNTISAHKIACATASLEHLEVQRMQAETVVHRFDTLSRELGASQAEATMLAQMDSRIELAAVISEISHLVGEHIVLSRVEFIGEQVATPKTSDESRGAAVRVATPRSKTAKSKSLGDVKFRILLAGVAANPGDVGDLVCRLEASSYFRDVHPSGFRNGTIKVPTARPATAVGRDEKASSRTSQATLEVSEFEITCYLANYDEIEG